MILVIYLLLVNVIAFGMMGYDKHLAQKRQRRVPEARLFLYAILGGALGAWLGMRTYRHKTKHPSFVFGMPALLVVNAICVYLLLQL